MFILSFVKRVEVLGTEALIHYKMQLPQDVTGGTKTTDTVKITKNGDRREKVAFTHTRGDRPSTQPPSATTVLVPPPTRG